MNMRVDHDAFIFDPSHLAPASLQRAVESQLMLGCALKPNAPLLEDVHDGLSAKGLLNGLGLSLLLWSAIGYIVSLV